MRPRGILLTQRGETKEKMTRVTDSMESNRVWRRHKQVKILSVRSAISDSYIVIKENILAYLITMPMRQIGKTG